MDIKWKVQVLDKMFDDTYVRNLYLKMKYGTLGRFSFDIRDFGTVEAESYFAVGNTIRIFWGDILKMEGVIQKLVKSTTSWGWSIMGCDLNGLLLDRTPNMPYELGCDSLTIANSVMYAGCDFPTSMWGVGDGETQGAYVLRYKVGLNTAYKQLRNLPHDLTWQTTTGGEGGIVSSVTTTSIVDNTKNWAIDQWKGAHCRMVTGAAKNNVYAVLGNTQTALNISPDEYWDLDSTITYGGHISGTGPMFVVGSDVYVSGAGSSGTIKKYNFDTGVIADLGVVGNCVCVDSGGYIYGYVGKTIYKYTSLGGRVASWGPNDPRNTISGFSGLVVHGDRVYAGVIYNNNWDSTPNSIQVFSTGGGYITAWPACATPPPTGDASYGIASIFIQDGFVYVGKNADSRINKFTLAGDYVSTVGLGKFTLGYGIVIALGGDSEHLYAGGIGVNDLVVLTHSGDVVETMSIPPGSSSKMIFGVAQSQGYLYVAYGSVSDVTLLRLGQGSGTSAPDITSIISPGDIYELTKGQTITWTKKYRVTNVKMTKNTHVISYNHTKDASKTHNSISVSGRDDNGGQIYTSLDDSSPITTLLSQESILSAPISASDTTIPVHDTTGFASSGEAWIE